MILDVNLVLKPELRLYVGAKNKICLYDWKLENLYTKANSEFQIITRRLDW